jgi:hypothetical protein
MFIAAVGIKPRIFAEYWTTMFMYINHYHHFHLGRSSNDKAFSILSLPVHSSLVSVSALSLYPFVKLSAFVTHSEGSEFYPQANLCANFSAHRVKHSPLLKGM